MKPESHRVWKSPLRFAFLSITLLLTQCIKAPEDNLSCGPQDVTFTINLPSSHLPQTRAIPEFSDQSNWISTLDILLFDAKDLYVATYTFDVFTVELQKSLREMTLKLPQGKFRIVMLANAREALSNQNLQPGRSTRQELQSKITFGITSGYGWNTDPTSSTYLYFPMWGETPSVIELPFKGATEDQKTLEISLLKMLARVNVISSNNFQLKSVNVYNYPTKGYLIPESVKWEVTPLADRQATEVPNSRDRTLNPLSYGDISIGEGTDANGQPVDQLRDDIFLFEATRGIINGINSNMCLVIGGVYQGQMGYYRVDLMDKKNNFIEILRNHKYVVQVLKVSSPGYNTPRDAYENPPRDMQFEIFTWNESEPSAESLINGEELLWVDPGFSWTFYKNFDSQKALIQAVNTNGWKVEKITELLTGGGEREMSNDWLQIDKITGNTYGANDVKIKTTISVTDNNTGSQRTGYIYLVAGHLQQRLTVVQFHQVENLLTIMNDQQEEIGELFFGAANGIGPAQRVYQVKWSPRDEALTTVIQPVVHPQGGFYALPTWVYYNTVSGSYVDNNTTINPAPINSGTGLATYTIQPEPITHGMGGIDLIANPFFERQVRVEFSATGSLGVMKKSVLLRQMVYNIQVTKNSFYVANGSAYSFNVKSNRPWRAYLMSNGNNIVAVPLVNYFTPFASGDANLPQGTECSFTTANDVASNRPIGFGVAKVRIEYLTGNDKNNPAHWTQDNSTDLICTSATRQLPANCYVLQPGAGAILIPVKRANGLLRYSNPSGFSGEIFEPSWPLGKQITGDFTAELLWSDTPGGTAFVGTPIKDIKTVGSGEEGFIYVEPGNVSGNSVIVVKVGGQVVWSWHIWVTSYTPLTTGVWMDRNLGALNNVANNGGSLGMHYQWGRKDPFPPASGPSTNTQIDIYGPVSIITGGQNNQGVQTSAGNTLQNALNYPLTFITNWSGSNGLFSWVTSENPTLGNGNKTLYDPCPAGWRVPIRNSVYSWNSASNRNYWGNEMINQDVAMGNPSASVATLKGINWPGSTPYKGGFYPAASTRDATGLIQMGQRGAYWSASAQNATLIYQLYFQNTELTPSALTIPPSQGASVRCVAE